MSSRRERRSASGIKAVLALPAAFWFALFLAAPLSIVVLYSFLNRGTYGGLVFEATGQNYARAFDWIYLRILWSSVQLAVLTSISCLILGFPLAYVMATARPRTRNALAVMVVLPFWTNFVIRAYGIKVLLGSQGPLAWLLAAIGVWEPGASLAESPASVGFGMVTNYLPFMVLPIYVSLEKLDMSLVEAARDLGASKLQAFFRVLVPLSWPGISTGLVFVFAPALGEFVVPDLLGGARTMMMGNLITDQFLKSRDWPFGSALALMLIAAVLVGVRILRRERQA